MKIKQVVVMATLPPVRARFPCQTNYSNAESMKLDLQGVLAHPQLELKDERICMCERVYFCLWNFIFFCWLCARVNTFECT